MGPERHCLSQSVSFFYPTPGLWPLSQTPSCQLEESILIVTKFRKHSPSHLSMPRKHSTVKATSLQWNLKPKVLKWETKVLSQGIKYVPVEVWDTVLWSWAPFFIFWPPIYFPRHSLPTNPLSVTCHQVTWSQGVPRILLDCHVTLQAHWLPQDPLSDQ